MDDLQFQSVKVTSIKIGATLRMPISDERGVLLLAAGQKVTREFFDHLVARNIEMLRIHETDLPFVVAGFAQGTGTQLRAPHSGGVNSEANPGTQHLDHLLDQPENLQMPEQEEAFAASVPKPPREAFSEETRQEMIEQQEKSIQQVQEMFDRLITGGGLDLDSLQRIADEALEGLTTDCDLFAALGLNPLSKDYPARHCLHDCMLALSIGTQLKLDRKSLKELAIGCMIHDAGMLRIDQRVVHLPRPVSALEFLEISKHPVRIFDMVRKIEQIPNRSAFIAYQMHERNDGSGYPRGRSGEQIHFLSKVAAVADVYTALVTPRAYRPGLQPHFALQQVIAQGNAGVLDASAVRALLQTTSMYPLGSYVLLSDGRVARTIRSNGMEFDSPVVEAWVPGQLQADPEIVDLLSVRELSIVRAIPSLDCDPDQLAAEPKEISQTLKSLVDLLDLADNCISDEIKKKRNSSRFSFRSDIRVYFKAPQGPGEWQAVTLLSRNLSQTGISLVGEQADFPKEVVIALQNQNTEPMYFLSHIVRRENIRDNFWEYGLQFQKRTVPPQRKKNR